MKKMSKELVQLLKDSPALCEFFNLTPEELREKLEEWNEKRRLRLELGSWATHR